MSFPTAVVAMSRILRDTAIQATVLMLIAWITTRLLSRSSSALRHRVWSLTMIALVALPMVSWLMPIWEWEVLPATPPSEQSSATIAAPFVPAVPVTNEVALNPAPTEADVRPKYAANVRDNDVRDDAIKHATEKTAAGPPVFTPPAAVSSIPRLVLLLAGVWLTGVVVGLFGLAAGLWQIRELSRHSQATKDDFWRPTLVELCKRLQMHRTVELRESAQSIVPLTWGFFRPRVMVPLAARTWTTDMRRVVLLHELAHVKRADVAFQLLGRLACAVYWFHPLAWLALRQLQREREQACDDAVIHTGESACKYAERLVEVARLCCRPGGLTLALEMARPSQLEYRLKWMFDSARSHRPLTWKLGMVVLLVTMVLLFIVVTVRPVARDTSTIPTDEEAPNQKFQAKLPPVAQQITKVDKPAFNPEELAQKGTFTIMGRVIEESTSVPVAGAAIFATGGWDSSHAYETTTDSDGRYRFETQNDSYEIHASASGKVSAPLMQMRIKVGEVLDAPDLKIGKTETVSGRVVDWKTGQPVTTTRNGEPLFVAYSCWGNRGIYKEFGSAPVQHDGTYVLDVPQKTRPLIYLRDPDVEYRCENQFHWAALRNASGETRPFDFQIIGPRNESAFVSAASPLDEIEVAEDGEPLNVDEVLGEVRNFYSSVRLGEFTAREEYELLEREGRKETWSADIRGVFDRGRELVRHEYERLDTLSKKDRERELVVLQKDFSAVAHANQVDLRVDLWYQHFPERIPFDPMAAGFFDQVRVPNYAGDDKVRKIQDLGRFEEILFKVTPENQHLEREIRAFKLGEFVVLMLKIHNQKQAIDWVQRTILDPTKGYAPVRTASTFSQFGKPSETRRMLNVTWQQRGDVWIPSVIDEFHGGRVKRERRTVRLKWKSVNQPIAADEFDIFQMMPNGFILGMNQLSADRQKQFSEKMKAYEKSSNAFRSASSAGVLQIDTTRVSSDGRHVQGRGLGIVVDGRGYLVTMHHLVDRAESIQVTRGNRSTYPAQIVASDPAYDLALIKFEPKEKLHAPRFGVSSVLKTGATVYATQEGPFRGLRMSRITALDGDVEIDPAQPSTKRIQTTLSISAAATGGPLINNKGEIVGINVASRTEERDLGIAIPIDDAQKVIAELMINADRNNADRPE